MRLLTLLALSLGVAGCTTERIVLLPSQDGRPSALVVRQGGAEQNLTHPYATVARQAGSLNAYTSSPDEVAGRFAPVLAALPARPKSFRVNFLPGGDALAPESVAEFERIKAEIGSHSSPEVVVVGHTDRVGSLRTNDELSLKRAQSVREALIAAGVPAEVIEAYGRGEREPLVPTEDEVDEPRNRRVEISVR
ncbi:MAG TPA: OmpA family protein [Rhodocyclaceae bacterium]|nr:OmpA family protein [Rhodocyclaceae bacterium]